MRAERRWIGRTVVVHTFRGPSLQGVLIKTQRGGWVLGNVQHLDQDATLAGLVSVPRSNGFLQFPEAGS